MQLQVTTSKVGDATVVSADGELDLHTAASLKSALDDAIDAGDRLIVADLGPVDFMDSTGLSVIISAVAALGRDGRELRVVASAPRIKKVFELTGVDQQVGIYASVDEAVSG